MGSADNSATFLHVASQLSAMGVSYIHIVDGIGSTSTTGATWYGRVDSSGFHGCSMPITLAALKTAFGDNLIGNGGYTAESAAAMDAAAGTLRCYE